MWRKGSPPTLLVGMYIGAATMENNMEVSQKTKNMTQQFHSWVYIPKKPPKTLIRKEACTPMFIAVLFTIAKIGKQPKCPSTDE